MLLYMWIQAMPITLPRVQQHYSVLDSSIGSLSSAMFAGMMFGAVGWGTCSDILGRSAAFNVTLFFTAVFGFFASFASSFGMPCFALFLLGSTVGDSMPTDSTLLEYMPKEKQYSSLPFPFSSPSAWSSQPLSPSWSSPETLAPIPALVLPADLGSRLHVT
ncbi:hypothetical protein P691DRAFT_87758 [Macrolepiota fuliginosa MF-IS2]|uniref:Major facilitator superfamily (MFS) profile domain-containing protein n=1 Tax=Macrolepiota fuliginosa MF-IS2 TaxID=1400762 RepID=A0A9P6BVC4_9AGAR|nr:hypothetical protein P691DRAFT_87758 [Macrolepiota fuliginosa MF-IS2]